MGDALQGQPVQQLRPGHPQKRPDDPAPLGGNAAQAPGACAPDQVQEHRLRVVVGVVGRGDQLRGRPLQEGVAQVPGRGFQALAGCGGVGSGVPPAHRQGNTPVGAEASAECLVPVRLRAPKAVVEVGGRQPQPQGIGAGAQQGQQGHGIRPAGQGHGDAASGRDQLPGPAQKGFFQFHSILF